MRLGSYLWILGTLAGCAQWSDDTCDTRWTIDLPKQSGVTVGSVRGDGFIVARRGEIVPVDATGQEGAAVPIDTNTLLIESLASDDTGGVAVATETSFWVFGPDLRLRHTLDGNLVSRAFDIGPGGEFAFLAKTGDMHFINADGSSRWAPVTTFAYGSALRITSAGDVIVFSDSRWQRASADGSFLDVPLAPPVTSASIARSGVTAVSHERNADGRVDVQLLGPSAESLWSTTLDVSYASVAIDSAGHVVVAARPNPGAVFLDQSPVGAVMLRLDGATGEIIGVRTPCQDDRLVAANADGLLATSSYLTLSFYDWWIPPTRARRIVRRWRRKPTPRSPSTVPSSGSCSDPRTRASRSRASSRPATSR
ncbi:MAG TPA: hypothetical protein VFQ53_22000 [Kofleriaceae bacterium]|nr:hypothetical protein [Kofleriaceae bacterium]